MSLSRVKFRSGSTWYPINSDSQNGRNWTKVYDGSDWRLADFECRVKVRSGNSWDVYHGTVTNLRSKYNTYNNTAKSFYACFQTSDGWIHFYHSDDTSAGKFPYSGVHYNKFRNGRWHYSENQLLFGFRDPQATVACGDVVYHADGFRHPNDTRFPYMMCMTVQPLEAGALYSDFWDNYGNEYDYSKPASFFDVGWGLMYLSFANSPEGPWTAPIQTSADGSNAFLIEQASAIVRGNQIFYTVNEGSFDPYLEYIDNQQTLTYMVYANIDSPMTLNYYRPARQYFTKNCNIWRALAGFNPGASLNGGYYTQDNYTFFNLSTAFDHNTGYFYITRAYSYPISYKDDLTKGVTPCNNVDIEGEEDSIGIFHPPNRLQILRMHIGTTPNAALLYDNSWEFIADLGYAHGFYYHPAGTHCQQTPLDPKQTNIGGDINTGNFLRTPSGALHSRKVITFAGDPTATRSVSGRRASDYFHAYLYTMDVTK